MPPAGLFGLSAVAALALAVAYPMQVNGYNQNAHYALVRSFAAGTPTIDRSRGEIGQLSTQDAALHDGHWYSNKAPGLAYATVPAFFVVEGIGMRTTGDPTRVIWALHLWAIVGAYAVLLLLVRALADRLQPGYGTIAAVAIGLGTLLLPFATLFFAHVLSAALGFAAYAVLWREREGPPRPALLVTAGALAGLAVTTEYSLVLLAAVLTVFALLRGDLIRRGLAWTGGVVVGLVPLAAYDLWAYRSLFHSTYEGNRTGELRGFYGLGSPSPHLLFDVLFSAWGLVTLTPVLVAGAAGGILALRRAAYRAEVLVALATVAVYLIWSSAFRLGISPFGGLGPPRYLIPILAFLGVLLAVAFRAAPLATGSLALVSGFQMVTQTSTNPLAAYDGDWLSRLTHHDVSQTAAGLVGVTGWYSIVPFFLAVLVGVTAAVAAAPRPALRVRDALLASVALAVWGLTAAAAHNPAGRRFGHDYVFGVVVVLAVAALAAAFASRLRTHRALQPIGP